MCIAQIKLKREEGPQSYYRMAQALQASRYQLSCSVLSRIAMQFTKTLLALAAVFGAVFQLQGCGAATTEAPGNTSNSTRMLEDAELLA